MKLKSNAREALLERILGLICLAVGMGVLALFGQAHLPAHMDPEWIVLIGVLAVLCVVGIVIASIAVEEKEKISAVRRKAFSLRRRWPSVSEVG